MNYINSLLLKEREYGLEKINQEINRINDLIIEYRDVVNDITENNGGTHYQLEKYKEKIKKEENFLQKCVEIKKMILYTID